MHDGSILEEANEDGYFQDEIQAGNETEDNDIQMGNATEIDNTTHAGNETEMDDKIQAGDRTDMKGTNNFDIETWGSGYMTISYWDDALNYNLDNFQDAVPEYTSIDLDDDA